MPVEAVYGIILCGGVSSRLWPLCINEPKQFLRHGNNHSYIQATLKRVLSVPNIRAVLHLSNASIIERIIQNVKLIDSDVEQHYYVEKYPIGTAASIVNAILALINQHKVDPNSMVLITPCDHLIHDVEQFNEAISRAKAVVESNKIVVIGVKAKDANSNYGYCYSSAALKNQPPTFRRFIAKVSKSESMQLIANGYLFNTGIVCAKINVMLEAFQVYCHELFNAMEEIRWDMKAINIEDSICHLLNKKPVDNISIDEALLDKAANIDVIEGSFDWVDVGTWDAYSAIGSDGIVSNNIGASDVILDSDVINCYIRSNKTIAIAGVSDLIVVETDDVIMIAKKGDADRIRSLYKRYNQQIGQ